MKKYVIKIDDDYIGGIDDRMFHQTERICRGEIEHRYTKKLILERELTRAKTFEGPTVLKLWLDRIMEHAEAGFIDFEKILILRVNDNGKPI
jgi:hypothetical protein